MPLPMLVSRNGELIPPAQAQVSIFNPAFYGSYGVYESMQVVRGRPFALEPHLERLEQSAALIDLKLPAAVETLGRWAEAVLEANEAGDCTLRIFVLGPENGGAAAAYLWPQPSPVYPAAFYESGASAVTYEGRRFMPQAKTFNTLVSYLAQRKAQAAGAHEGLLHQGGCVTEGASSNLFVVMEGEVLTAPDHEVLAGVARDALLQLAAGAGTPVRRAAPLLDDLPDWDECFITSTSRHVMPITTLDGTPIGDGRIGPITRRLMGIFEDYFRSAILE